MKPQNTLVMVILLLVIWAIFLSMTWSSEEASSIQYLPLPDSTNTGIHPEGLFTVYYQDSSQKIVRIVFTDQDGLKVSMFAPMVE